MKKIDTLFFLFFCYFTLFFFCPSVKPSYAAPSHAIAMHGNPALPKDFIHFNYVNPNAPKGGTIRYGAVGTFDSVNPFIVQGNATRGITDDLFGNLLFDKLMMRAVDEPFTLYPLIAKTIETNDKRDYVEFTLDERARFSDGEPVKPEDFIFTLEILAKKGWPRYATVANKIKTIEKVGTHGVKIIFKNPDREFPLILGNMIILPKHAIDPETFHKSTLKPMIGTGPYILESIRPGESVVFRRNPTYWGANLPSTRGQHNYDRIIFTYFRDENTLFEAFRKGLIDVFFEGDSNRWKNQYAFSAVKKGKIQKETFKNTKSSGMYSIVMNTRKEIFKDPKLRRALADSFDFEWINTNLLDSCCIRIKSYFDHSDLSSSGRVASVKEKELLAPFPDSVSQDILEKGWVPPASNGKGNDRNFLLSIVQGFSKAGYTIDNKKMKGGAEKKPLSFELMIRSKEEEKISLAWQQTLSKIGIDITIRSVDSVQFQQRLIKHDYDSFFMSYPSSLSPGIEQIGRFGSSSRDKQGTFNLAGAANPALDSLIEKMLQVETRSELIDVVRAYDRVLLTQSYVVPLYFWPQHWVARWSRIKRPEKIAYEGFYLPSWWFSE